MLEKGFKVITNWEILRFDGDWNKLRARMCFYRQSVTKYSVKNKKIK